MPQNSNASQGPSGDDAGDGPLHSARRITRDISIRSFEEDELVNTQAHSALAAAHPFSTSGDEQKFPVPSETNPLLAADEVLLELQSAPEQAQHSVLEPEEKKDGTMTPWAKPSGAAQIQASENLVPAEDGGSKLKKAVQMLVALGHAAPMGLAVASVVDEAHRLDAKLHILGGCVLGVLTGLALFTAADGGSGAGLHLLNAVQLGGLFLVNEFVSSPDPRVYTAVAAEAVLLLFALSIICRQPRA